MAKNITPARRQPTKLKVAVLGLPVVGKHTIIDRQLGWVPITDTNYIHEIDPFDNFSYDSPPLTIANETIHLNWHWSSLYHHDPHFPHEPPITAESAMQELSAIRRQILYESDAIVFVYRVNERTTFEALAPLWEDFQLKYESYDYHWERGPLYGRRIRLEIRQLWVVANMIDLPESKWEVSLAEGEELAKELGAQFRAMSGKTGVGCAGFGQDVAISLVTAEGKEWDLKSSIDEESADVVEVKPLGMRQKLRNLFVNRRRG